MKYTFDSREIEKGDCFVALKGEKADGRDFIPAAKEKGAAEIIEGLEALHDAARAKRMRLKATVVALTGSAGKTTTKELLRAFLSKAGRTYATQGNFNNHIGLPLTILNCPEDAEFLVLEMGTNHPGEIAALCDIAEPDAALITGIGTAHLEFFKTREAIAEEKGTLAARAKTFCVYPGLTISPRISPGVAARPCRRLRRLKVSLKASSSARRISRKTQLSHLPWRRALV